MKKLIYPILSLLMFLIVGCSKDDIEQPDNNNPDNEQTIPDNTPDPDYETDYNPISEKSENYNITYQYKEGVKVLNEVAQKYLISIENDTILYFSHNTPSNILPETGEIVASKISDKVPFGLGNKVTSVFEEGNEIKCVTTTASFNEIFEKLELESNYSLSTLTKGNYDLKSRATLGDMDLITIPIEVGNNGWFAEMSLNLGGVLTFNFNLTEETYELSLTTGIEIKGEAGVKYEFNPEDDDEELKKILDLLPSTTVFEGVIPIAGGVVTLRPFVDFGLYLAGALEGKLSLGFGKSFIYKAGWTQEGYFSEDLTDKNENILKSLDLEGSFKVGPVASFDLGLGLWTKNLGAKLNISPNLMIGGELGLSFSTEKTCLIDNQELFFEGNIDVAGAVFIKFFEWEKSSEIDFAQIPLFRYDTNIFPPAPVMYPFKQSDNPLNYIIEMRFENNSLIKYLYSTPILFIEDNDELIATVIDENPYWGDTHRLTFNVDGLSPNVEYMLTPGFLIGDIFYYWKEYRFVEYADPWLTLNDVEIVNTYYNEAFGEYRYDVKMTFDFENVDSMGVWGWTYGYWEGSEYKEYSDVAKSTAGIQDGINIKRETFSFYQPNVKVTITPEFKTRNGFTYRTDPYIVNFIYSGN
ncbi:MAG: hypothetical protein J1F67_07245 [Muribaculaceae bacterium]|nr:hypothetical protein [Muribaculaceae bacterium]